MSKEGSDAMRVVTRVRRLRFSRKVCWAVIPAAWFVFFITLSLYNDREVAGKSILVRTENFSQIIVAGRDIDSAGMP